MNLPTFSLLETRALGVLVEKQHTVPDTYPLTLLALTAGCNQKTSRDPILNASEAEVQAAIDQLKTLSLVVESSGGRVMRYAQNVGRVLAVPTQAVALLAALMLRGPQTVGELRINCDRLHHFADISAVEGFLHELAGRPAGALVVELARQPGARETRWAHLLSGAPAVESAGVQPDATNPARRRRRFRNRHAQGQCRPSAGRARGAEGDGRQALRRARRARKLTAATADARGGSLAHPIPSPRRSAIRSRSEPATRGARVHVPAAVHVVVDLRRAAEHAPVQEDGKGGGLQRRSGNLPLR